MKLNSDLIAKAAGLERLDPGVVERLETYGARLIEANEKINLISRSVDPQRELETQIVLSVVPHRFLGCVPGAWIDIGSGGGFPVVPLAIVCPHIEFTAVEPVAKKAFFIERTAQELKLDNLSVESITIEGLISKNLNRHWPVTTIKAVTDLNQSLKWSRQLLAQNGMMITYKPAPLDHSEIAIARENGFEYIASHKVKELIDTIDIYIVVCKKL